MEHFSQRTFSGLVLAAAAMAIACPVHAQPQRLNPVHDAYPPPQIAFEAEIEEAPADDSLAAAIADTFASNPGLAARRYDLRATDDEVGVALSQTRPQVQMQVSGGYELTLPGAITQSNRSIADRLANPCPASAPMAQI